ncbi:hypothetical protein BDV95DRAFT_668935 [Massariosphaeria phaeospora]|uniref:Uncharacterized protein n=1 Tax=Massariosphaeria phaeospora TaxID=100035 RepID=A0A7C8M7I3_9PLEO|nr:hypothetical protein BDV95DRAFT_668935 [Massariosphaeria phaeospora]
MVEITMVDHQNERDEEVPSYTPSHTPLELESPSNRDTMSVPPAYAQMAADNEVSLDDRPIEHYKPERPAASTAPSSPIHTVPRRPLPGQPSATASSPWFASTFHEASSLVPVPPTAPVELPAELHAVYLSEIARNVAETGGRTCSILRDRQAVWLVKRKKMVLCPLAATVLVKEGLICHKDLEFISPSSGVKRDPSDPVSGVFLATYDILNDTMHGLVEGPVEFGREVAPLMKGKQRADATGPVGSPVENPKAARHMAVGTGKFATGAAKGMGRIVGTMAKSPMTLTYAVTRGFHNVPKLYGEEVREYENITDLRSGLAVGALGLGHGIGDGLKDIFLKPIEGAQKDGALGFVKGIGKGLGNAAWKPAAGCVGVVGYSSVGVYQQIKKIKWSSKDPEGDNARSVGEAEFVDLSDELRLEVVKMWCQVMMHKN